MTKEQRLKKRHNAEKRFRFYGLASIFFALLFVLILVHNIFSKGSSAFMKTAINVEVFFDQELLCERTFVFVNSDRSASWHLRLRECDEGDNLSKQCISSFEISSANPRGKN